MREKEALWVGGGGMWLEKTAGCLPTGSDAAAGAVVGEHTCHSVRLTLFSLLVSMWIMDSASHSLPRCYFIQYAPTYADPGFSNWLAVRILFY